MSTYEEKKTNFFIAANMQIDDQVKRKAPRVAPSKHALIILGHIYGFENNSFTFFVLRSSYI